MLVKIRVQQGPRIKPGVGKNRNLALAFAALLTPAALMAGVLGVWRLGADLNLVSQFAITQGVFSHWQVWLCVAAALQITALVLKRYGRNATSELDDSSALQKTEDLARAGF